MPLLASRTHLAAVRGLHRGEAMRRVLVCWMVASSVPAYADGFIPPMKIDFGVAMSPTGTVSRQTMIGLSTATVYPRSTWLDVGAGYLIATTGARVDATARTTMPIDDDSITLHGGFADLAVRVFDRPGVRGWAGVRGEAGYGGGAPFFGVAGRATLEGWMGFDAGCHARVSGIYGALSAAVWAEVGSRSGAGAQASHLAVGLTFRLPMIGLHGGSGGCCASGD